MPTRDDDIARLSALLAAKHRELAFVRVQELQAQYGSPSNGIPGMWENSAETSVAGREHDMRHASADFTAAIIEIRGEIAALETEYNTLTLTLPTLPLPPREDS